MESADVTAEYIAAVERIARAVFPVVMSQVTGREPLETYDTTITDNREAEREIARAALSAVALPERELLAEALSALEPFAADEDAWNSTVPDEHFPVVDYGRGSLGDASYSVGDLRRARAAADKIRAAMGGE